MIEKLKAWTQWRLHVAKDRSTRLRWHLANLADFHHPVERDSTITLVVVGRNDNYGGDFRGRLRTTLEWNLRHPFSEAIYVEWNPLPDRPSDAPWLVERHPQLKVYVVSAERHKRCCTNPNMPLMEYFAKNVGIRRATSDFICLVNADVLIGPDVFPRLARLSKDRYYGTHNINIRWHGRSIDAPDLKTHALWEFSAKPFLFSVVGDFILAHRDLWHRARGYDESLTDKRNYCDNHGAAQLYSMGARPRIIGLHYHLDHPESCRNATFAHQGKEFDPWTGIPYANNEDWGQADAVERQIGERTWRLE